eukprot:3012787-Rhodomonas_salina.2
MASVAAVCAVRWESCNDAVLVLGVRVGSVAAPCVVPGVIVSSGWRGAGAQHAVGSAGGWGGFVFAVAIDGLRLGRDGVLITGGCGFCAMATVRWRQCKDAALVLGVRVESVVVPDAMVSSARLGAGA